MAPAGKQVSASLVGVCFKSVILTGLVFLFYSWSQLISNSPAALFMETESTPAIATPPTELRRIQNTSKKEDNIRRVPEKDNKEALEPISSLLKPAQEEDDSIPAVADKENTCPGGIVFMMYATHHGRDDRFCRTLESVVRHRIPMNILGWGLKWEGLSQKLRGSLEAVMLLPQDCIVVFTDAYDVLYQEEAAKIKKKFLEFNKPLVFSAECGCWPHIIIDKDICWKKYPESPTPYRYLNSGQWIGYASAIAPVLLSAVAKTQGDMKANDQEIVADFYLSKKFDIVLDHNGAIFQALHRTDPPDLPFCNPWEHMALKNERWENILTHNTPSIFHFNGGGKAFHLKMEKKLWYRQSRSNTAEHISKIKETELLFEGNLITFNKICPSHVF